MLQEEISIQDFVINKNYSVATAALLPHRCQREWCRVLWYTDFYRPPPLCHDKASRPDNNVCQWQAAQLVQWFRDFPGLRRLVGGMMVGYYAPASAQCLNEIGDARPSDDEISQMKRRKVSVGIGNSNCIGVRL